MLLCETHQTQTNTTRTVAGRAKNNTIDAIILLNKYTFASHEREIKTCSESAEVSVQANCQSGRWGVFITSVLLRFLYWGYIILVDVRQNFYQRCLYGLTIIIFVLVISYNYLLAKLCLHLAFGLVRLFYQSQYKSSRISWNSPNANWLERAVIGRY